jgi:hypothetical protein
MRPDEEYVKQSIEKYLSCITNEFTIIDGDEPPDYYIQYKNEKILLEVTRAEPVYFDNGVVENRNTVDRTLIKLCNQLDIEIGSNLDANKSLLLDIKGPLINYIKFKNSIRNKIVSFLKDNQRIALAYKDWINIDVYGNVIRIKLINSSPQKKRIVGFVSIHNNKTIVDIEAQAGLILSNRIQDKEEKTKVINNVEWCGRKWLAIYNNYWLASSETYKRAILNLKEKHTFSKIFLIGTDFEVTEIYSC